MKSSIKDSNIIKNDWWDIKRKEIKQEIIKELNLHVSQVTDIEKIVINSGVGVAATNPQLLENTRLNLFRIVKGQKPAITKTKKAVINFKTRVNMNIGCKVTLRRKRAWDFLFELININLVSIPNFKGFSEKKFDYQSNYHFGINDLNIFPASSFELTFKNQGIQISIIFKSNSLLENKLFLSKLKFPITK